ncbi:hypothetical protein ACJRO7_013108 [Eucalyptus globulus]|uniref:Glabrous enhancer-binding protein-like DBD domain-containing protein n=1 Tax=Eucalyptus globulus TaxID=34317 RepID=A0ABD3LVL1_EUCGL
MSTPVELRMSPRLRSRASSSPASAQSSDHRPPAGEQQNPRPDKLFSEEDEIRLLKSLSKLTNPTADPPTLDRIEKSLGPSLTRAQIANKIRRLRHKYHRQARTKALIRTPHDRKVFELARDVWGKRLSSRKERKERKGKEEKKQQANLEEEKEKDEGEILGGEEESGGVVAAATVAVADLGSFPALVEECERCFPGNGVWREGLKRLEEGRLRKVNERVVWLRMEEATLMAKKAELAQDLTRMILDSVVPSSSQAPTA